MTKKFKWNWLDTVIVCIVLAVIAAACFIFLRPQSTGETITAENTDIFITIDTSKAEPGTYDNLKVGDEIRFANSNKIFGTVAEVEMIPYQSSVFNEETKEYEVYSNENLQICRFTVKAVGYRTDRNEVYAASKQMAYSDELNLETQSIRLSGTVSGIKGGEADE